MKLSKANRQRVYIYGGLLAGMVGGYLFQPVRIDFIPRHAPKNNPPVDPDSSRLLARDTRVMVVTAHPDDTEYYLGGTLLKLAKAQAKIWLVVCTDGDKAYYFLANNTALRKTRRDEQLKASKVWNAQGVEFLGFPDGRLHPNADVVAKIEASIDRVQPDYVIAFDADFPPRASHGDHRSAGDAALIAARQSNAKWALLFSTIAPNYRNDVSGDWDRRMDLLALHESQFAGDKLKRIQETIASDAMDAAGEGQASYVEPFRCVRLR